MANAYREALGKLDSGKTLTGRIIAGGGAVRRNPALLRCLAEALPLPLETAPEEADSMEGLRQTAGGTRGRFP